MRFYHRLGWRVLAVGRQVQPPSQLLRFADYCTFQQLYKGGTLPTKVCIHAAGLASDTASWEQLYESNVKLVQQVFQAVRPQHFIFISSASVYPHGNGVHHENEEVQEKDISLYGRSKREAERWLSAFSKQVKITVLRPRALYGVGDRVLLPRLAQLSKGPFFLLPWPLDYSVSLTCIDLFLEVTRRLIAIATPASFEVYNVADRQVYHLQHVFREVAQLNPRGPWVIKVGENFLGKVAGLGLSKTLTPAALQYFLAHHRLDTARLGSTCGTLSFPNFYEYCPKLRQWVEDVGFNSLKKKQAELPWIGEF